jgi:hypothetical protein
MKSRIVEQLGQAEILLPGLVAEGLSANDRAKVRMSALQAAVEHAHDPLGQAADLAAECRNAGVDAVATRSLIAGARNMASGIIDAPGLAKLGETLLADVATMIQAVSAGDAGSGKAAEDRFAALSVKLGLGKPQIAETEIAELTAVASGTRDSLHRLVMDLHKALNRLAAQCAEEVVAGAHTHGLHPDDKPLVAAFMRGLNRTRGLKFNHPGLDTIAIRAGSRLVILRSQASATIARLVDTAENTIDELEQAAFYASLVPPKLDPAVLSPLGELCAAAAAGTEAAARGLEAAVGIGDGESADNDDALAATERLADLEHAADDAERAVTAIVLKSDGDARQALSVLELARALERATDRLSAMGHLLHDHVMSGLSG